jgi:S-adenosylmethionine synthetase
VRDARQDRVWWSSPARSRRRRASTTRRSSARPWQDIGYTELGHGLRRAHLRDPHRRRAAEPRHLAGRHRGRGHAQGAGRRRSGPHVRLRDVDETPELMPAPIATRTARPQLAQVRKSKKVDWLRPDGKTQVTLEYENDKPVRIDAVVVSTQHSESVKHKTLKEAVMTELVIKKVAPGEAHRQEDQDTTSTRRGASSSAARWATAASRAARSSSTPTAAWAATAAAPSRARTRRRSTARPATTRATSRRTSSPPASPKRCEVQIAYAIGVAQPVGVHVNTFGTGKVEDETLEKYIIENFDMRPKAIIDELDLLRPIYLPTAGVRSLRPQGVPLGEHRRAPPRWPTTSFTCLQGFVCRLLNGTRGRRCGGRAAPRRPSRAARSPWCHRPCAAA